MEASWTAWAVAFVLVAVGTAWMIRHVRLWRRVQRTVIDPREWDYRRRQYVRRMQTSALLAVLGAAIFVGTWVARPPMLVVGYWTVVLGLTGWLMLLAAADALATRLHFGRMEDECAIAKSRLEAELRRLRDETDSSNEV